MVPKATPQAGNRIHHRRRTPALQSWFSVLPRSSFFRQAFLSPYSFLVGSGLCLLRDHKDHSCDTPALFLFYYGIRKEYPKSLDASQIERCHPTCAACDSDEPKAMKESLEHSRLVAKPNPLGSIAGRNP